MRLSPSGANFIQQDHIVNGVAAGYPNSEDITSAGWLFRPIYTELPVGLLRATREAGSAYRKCCLSGVHHFCAAARLAAS